MKIFKTFVLGILAGASVAIGGCVFLSLDNKIAGSALFTIGLFMVCVFKFNLFTGKVCYVFDNDMQYALNLIPIWLGNLAGALIVGGMLKCTRLSEALTEKAAAICSVKLSDTALSVFILAMFCNMMIYVGVEAFNRCEHEAGKYIGLFLCIMVFILSGFEHCVANMFYFTMGSAWSAHAVIWLLIMTAGNAAGGVAIPLLRKAQK